MEEEQQQSSTGSTTRRARAQRLLAIHRRCRLRAEKESALSAVAGSAESSSLSSRTAASLQRRQAKLERLNQLKRRRIALAAQLEETLTLSLCRGNNPRTTLFSELRQKQQQQQQKQQQGEKEKTGPCSSSLLLLQDAVHQQDLMIKLRQMRQEKFLAAAYRLSGISVFPVPDKDVLALRFDVGGGGGTGTASCACYHCFFDVAIDTTASKTTTNADATIAASSDNSDNNIMLYLRLVQHTLPPAIPLAAILQRHLGGVAQVGTLSQLLSSETAAESTTTSTSSSSSWNTADLLQKLRATANLIYHASHCLQVRKETLEYLQNLAATTTISAALQQQQQSNSPLPSTSKKKRKSPRISTNGSSSNSTAATNTNASEDITLPAETAAAAAPLLIQKDHNCYYSVDHVECTGGGSAAYTPIRFHLHHRLSGIARAVITLQYSTDLCRARAHQPVSVTVQLLTCAAAAAPAADAAASTAATASTKDDGNGGDDAEDHNDFIENAILAFRRLPIQEAMQQVTDAMAEC